MSDTELPHPAETEGDDDDPHVPEGLLELYEVLEWEKAVEAEKGSPS